MLTVDRLDFSKEKVFSNFRDALQKCDGKTKNLIDCKDDVMFAWDNKHKKLLTQNLKILNETSIYQELFPTEPPIVDIQFIRVNSTVSKAVLWGPNGAVVIDIPRRWGSHGAFQGGKDTIITRCKSIEERYGMEIRQIRFHPGSVQDNHVLLLSSDNTFRLYLLDVEGPEFLRTWSLGQNPLNLSGRVPFLVSLGDTAVDFDFAHPILDNPLPSLTKPISAVVVKIIDCVTSEQMYKKLSLPRWITCQCKLHGTFGDHPFMTLRQKRSTFSIAIKFIITNAILAPFNDDTRLSRYQEPSQLEKNGLIVYKEDDGSTANEKIRPDRITWPVIVLRGNGDVCVMNTSLTSNVTPKLEGPLPIYPPADDNYGVDACSILVMATVPNVVIVATSSGMVYHAVLLAMPKDERRVVPIASHGLYVLESVELELGIQLNDDDDTSYTCPVILHRDPLFRWKYYCTHNTGIHAVLMGFVPQIEKFAEEGDTDNFRLRQTPSTVEYLVCTRTDVTAASPILGFTIVKSWNLILAVLSNGDVIKIPLKMADMYLSSEPAGEEVVGDDSTPLKKLLKEPFEQHIKNLLKRNVNQPVLKLDKNSTISPQDCLDLVSRTTNILRQEYFTKVELVGDEIEQRASILTALKSLQLKELQELEDGMPELKDSAERIAEKYEEVKEKHQKLVRRIEDVLITVKKLEPIESIAEKKMKNELISVEEKLGSYEKSIKQLKEKLDYQQFKVTEQKSETKKLHLGDRQIETIKKNLMKCSGEIADLVSIINGMRSQLNTPLN